MVSLLLRLLPVIPLVVQLVTVEVCKHGRICIVLGTAEHGTCPSPSPEKEGDATGFQVVARALADGALPLAVVTTAASPPAPPRFPRIVRELTSQTTNRSIFRPPNASLLVWTFAADVRFQGKGVLRWLVQQ
jgi:hypothetical protein